MRNFQTFLILLFCFPFVVAQEVENESVNPIYISDIVKEADMADKGIFNTYMLGEDLYFELPHSNLNKEMLLVTRIAKTPTALSPYLNAGSKLGEQVVFWEKKRNKIL